MNRYLGLFFALALFASLPLNRADSDVAPNPMTGGHAVVRYDEGTTDVRMVQEDVVVRIYADTVVTIGSFSMRNDGETISMEVGFPFPYKDDLIRFRAFVDGQCVQVYDGQEEVSDHTGRKRWTTYWKLWNTTFHKRETCEIRVEYKTKPLESVLFRREDYLSLPADVVDTLRQAMSIKTVEYTLATGKGWKGVLDRCTVAFELVGMSDAHLKYYSPEDCSVTGNRFVWEYTDYEPRGAVFLGYSPYMPLQQIPEVLRGIVERFPDDPTLARQAGHFCANNLGRTDAQMEIYHSFLARWVEPIPQLMEYAPGGRCRFNYEAGNKFYTAWRMAFILFDECRRFEAFERCRDIAPTVSRISGAIVDSLDTCGNLPANDGLLLRRAKEMLDLSNELIDEGR